MGRGLRRWWWGWVPGMLVVVGLLAWWAWPSSPAPRARVYRDVDACLLTDAQGLASAQAAPVWAGMQDASLATKVRVSYLAVPGDGTSAAPYLSGLVQRRCRVVVVVGPAEVEAVGAAAARYPDVRFVMVGGASSGPNLTLVTDAAPDRVRVRVKSLVVEATR